MGEVYKAEQQPMGRHVALKILRRELSEDLQQVERFKREAQAASQLNHPNTITVYDSGQDTDSTLFLAMELLDGQPLSELLEKGRLDVHRAVHIMSQICGSLHEAHEMGVVHRDLKPENIFLVSRGHDPDYVKVLDFGIAKVTHSSVGAKLETITQAGTFFGTPQYMSPEQIKGQSLDARSDIYSMGVILYQMIAGHLPFQANSVVEMLTCHLGTQPQAIELSEEQQTEQAAYSSLKAIALKALSKEPVLRQPSARVFQEELMTIFPSTLHPTTSAGTSELSLGAERSHAGLIVFLTAALAAGVAFFYFQGGPTPIQPGIMGGEISGQDDAKVEKDKAKPDSKAEEKAKAKPDGKVEDSKAKDKKAAEDEGGEVEELDPIEAAKVEAEADAEVKIAEAEAKLEEEKAKAAAAAKAAEEKAALAAQAKQEAEAKIAAAEEEAAKQKAEAARAQAEKEVAEAKAARAKAEKEAAEAEAKAKAEKEAAEKKAAEVEAKAKAEKEAAEKKAAEAEAKAKTAQADADRKIAEKAAAEAKKIAEEAKKRERAAQAEAKKIAEEAKKRELAAQAEAKKIAEEAKKRELAAQAEAKKILEEAKKRELAAQAKAKQQAAETARLKAELQRIAEEKAAEEAKAEEARKKRAEAKRKRDALRRKKAAEWGKLVIRSKNRGVKIKVDGRLRGQTPMKVIKLRPGSHRIEASKNGKKVSRRIKLKGGKVMQVKFKL